MVARFELAYTPASALRHLRRDPDLARLIKRCGPFELQPMACPSPFQALAESIVHQQLNGRAAASIFARFEALFPCPMKPAHILAASEEALRGAGLSRAKAVAIRDLAEKTEGGLVPTWTQLRKLEDEAIIERLIQVRGVGRWTVEMLLIFRLGRPDVWPVDDFAVKKAYGLLLGEQAPKAREMAQRAEAWRPYRSVVAWYLWRSLAL
jgi:3-methyladenine DNA glycosylase/8-oxoguanine DNA glycosylase